MTQILSQDEIDALLSGLDEVTEEQPDKAELKDTEPGSVPLLHEEGNFPLYDFLDASRMSQVKARFPAFDAINDHFNRGLRTTISSTLRVVVDSSVIPVEIVTFKEFIRRMPVPSSLHILKIEPLQGHVMMLVDSLLVFSIVEIFLGSSIIGQSRVEGREFTSIEQRLMRKIVNSFLNDLEKAWRPIQPIEIHYVRSEINPQFAKIAQNDEIVIISNFQVDLEDISGDISLCIPLNVLQPIKQKLQSTFQGERIKNPIWDQKLISNLDKVEMDVTVPLGTASITGAELLDLGIGDIIQLDTEITNLLPVMINNKVKFEGHPGLYKGQRALQVGRVISSPDEI